MSFSTGFTKVTGVSEHTTKRHFTSLTYSMHAGLVDQETPWVPFGPSALRSIGAAAAVMVPPLHDSVAVLMPGRPALPYPSTSSWQVVAAALLTAVDDGAGVGDFCADERSAALPSKASKSTWACVMPFRAWKTARICCCCAEERMQVKLGATGPLQLRTRRCVDEPFDQRVLLIRLRVGCQYPKASGLSVFR
jgi:hypothetical protein